MRKDRLGQSLSVEVSGTYCGVYRRCLCHLEMSVTDTVEESPVIEGRIFHVRPIDPVIAALIPALSFV